MWGECVSFVVFIGVLLFIWLGLRKKLESYLYIFRFYINVDKNPKHFLVFSLRFSKKLREYLTFQPCTFVTSVFSFLFLLLN